MAESKSQARVINNFDRLGCTREQILFDNGIERLAPVFIWVVHHDVDENGHQKPEDLSAILNLRPVDTTVPGRPPVNKLIAQDIQPVKNKAQDACAVACLEGLRE